MRRPYSEKSSGESRVDPSDLLRRFVRVAGDLQIPYFVTGSVTLAAYGEIRLTNDVDVVVELAQNAVAPLCAKFPLDEFYVSEEAARDAVKRCSQFNILHTPSGLKIDVMVAADTPFNRSRFARARTIPLGTGELARFASPEDVILKKMVFYNEGESEKHLRDIAGILQSERVPLDMSYVAGWSLRLGVHTIWRAILAKLGRLDEYPFDDHD
jgi:hypothetical protein